VILSGFLPRKNRSEDANDAGWRCKDEIGSFFEIKMEYENITSIPLTRRQLWGADNSSLQSFIETINNGSLILQYYGHGTYASWDNIGKDDRPPETATNESFGNYHLARKISLTDKLPLVISAACNTGQIKQSPSLAELWMTELKSIGIFAADHISSDHWNARIVPRVHEQIVTLGKRRVGDILVGAMKKLNDDFSFGAFGKHTFRMYRYLGDPDTILKIPD
jgi:hypothetical protein